MCDSVRVLHHCGDASALRCRKLQATCLLAGACSACGPGPRPVWQARGRVRVSAAPPPVNLQTPSAAAMKGREPLAPRAQRLLTATARPAPALESVQPRAAPARPLWPATLHSCAAAASNSLRLRASQQRLALHRLAFARSCGASRRGRPAAAFSSGCSLVGGREFDRRGRQRFSYVWYASFVWH